MLGVNLLFLHVPRAAGRSKGVGLRGFDFDGGRRIYSADAHQDTGRTPEDWLENMHAYREGGCTEWAAEYLECMGGGRGDIGGQIQLDFWRTMRMRDHPAPLTHMPLAILDGATIELADLVPTALVGHGATGDPSCELAVRESSRHRCMYYPEVTLDEVIVLKQFQWIPALGESQPYRCPLHCAFADPSAPVSSTQERRSNEYRMQVWLGEAAPPKFYRNRIKQEDWVFKDSGIVWGGAGAASKL